MDKEFSQFLELFDSSPNIAILHIDNGFEDIADFLKQFIDENQGELSFKNIEDIDIKRLRLKDRNFEYAVLSNCLNSFEPKEQERFINGVYHSLENSAFIIVLEDRSKSDPFSMCELLDRCNFRAVNSIDIFEKYNLVMAKKLHMWGAGQ
jgi:hypothetical protein